MSFTSRSTRRSGAFRRRALILSSVLVATAFGCAIGDNENTARMPDPYADAGSDGGGGAKLPEAGPVPDAGSTTKDGGKDAGKDADGIDYGPPGPVGPPTGSACTKPGEEFELTCGQCGIQVAICVDGKVGTYGPCRGEKLGADNCIPGVTTTPECGFCGSKIRACRNDCTWTETKCKGEVTSTDRCLPGNVEQRVADCNDGEKRTYTCANDCAWGPPGACVASGM